MTFSETILQIVGFLQPLQTSNSHNHNEVINTNATQIDTINVRKRLILNPEFEVAKVSLAVLVNNVKVGKGVRASTRMLVCLSK